MRLLAAEGAEPGAMPLLAGRTGPTTLGHSNIRPDFPKRVNLCLDSGSDIQNNY